MVKLSTSNFVCWLIRLLPLEKVSAAGASDLLTITNKQKKRQTSCRRSSEVSQADYVQKARDEKTLKSHSDSPRDVVLERRQQESSAPVSGRHGNATADSCRGGVGRGSEITLVSVRYRMARQRDSSTAAGELFGPSTVSHQPAYTTNPLSRRPVSRSHSLAQRLLLRPICVARVSCNCN